MTLHQFFADVTLWDLLVMVIVTLCAGGILSAIRG